MTDPYSFSGMAFPALGQARLMLRETGSRDQADILYFRMADIRGRQAALAHRNVTFIGEPHLIHRHNDGTEERMTFFGDDEGRTLALVNKIKIAF